MNDSRPQRPHRRLAASAAGIGIVSVLGIAWLARAPIASWLIHQSLAASGVASTFELERVDFGGAALRDVRLGAGDVSISRIEAVFAWSPLPRVSVLRVDRLRLRVRADEGGLSLGQLDGFLRGGGGAGRVSPLPDVALVIRDARADVMTPYGPLVVTAQSSGRFGRDFVGMARLAPTTHQNASSALINARGDVDIRSNGDGLRAVGRVEADEARSAAFTGHAMRLTARLEAPTSLARINADMSVGAESVATAAVVAELIDGRARLRRDREANWRGNANLTAAATRDANAARAWRGANVALAADIRGIADDPLVVSGRLTAPSVMLTPEGRASFVRQWPALGALPIGPLSIAARDATIGGMQNATIDAPFSLSLLESGAVLTLTAPVEVRGANGARIVLRPLEPNRAMLTANLARGDIDGALFVETSGGGYPDAAMRLDHVRGRRNGPLQAQGALAIENWQTTQASLRAAWIRLGFTQRGAGGDLTLSGDMTMSGPIGGALVRDLAAPLAISIGWGEGVQVRPTGQACVNAHFAELAVPGVVFVNGAAPICAEPSGFFVTDANRRASGGFSIGAPAWAGHVEGEPLQTAQLSATRISARFSGTDDRLVMDALLDAPSLRVTLGPSHTLRAAGARVTAQLIASNNSWRAEGVFSDGVIDDATLPANVTNIATRWTATPAGDDAVVRFASGVARLTDRPPANASQGRLATFNPMRLADISGTLREGRVNASGRVVLEQGSRALGTFEATHRLENATGEATVHVRDLQFAQRQLQPDEITPLARGVVENVRGPLNGEIHARWVGDTLNTDGRFRLADMSLSSATMPIIEGVDGEVVFDDLVLMTTPPGQTLSVGLINPGIEVRDGTVQFQLERDGVVNLERVRWPFAGGELAVAPTRITLGAETTRFSLTLTNVDVAALLAQLNVPDLVATGRVGGQFPLVMTPTNARIEGGALSASEGGGTISYAGAAGRETTGPARLAFQALTSFRYDSLTLGLNGDLDGELITSINFSGRNAASLDMANGGLGGVGANVAGVPFVFNVRVTAPFRQLGAMAAGAFDPRVAIRQAGEAQQQPQPVDPNANSSDDTRTETP